MQIPAFFPKSVFLLLLLLSLASFLVLELLEVRQSCPSIREYPRTQGSASSEDGQGFDLNLAAKEVSFYCGSLVEGVLKDYQEELDQKINQEVGRIGEAASEDNGERYSNLGSWSHYAGAAAQAESALREAIEFAHEIPLSNEDGQETKGNFSPTFVALRGSVDLARDNLKYLNNELKGKIEVEHEWENASSSLDEICKKIKKELGLRDSRDSESNGQDFCLSELGLNDEENNQLGQLMYESLDKTREQ